MNITNNKFNPSTNIIRDTDIGLNYMTTPNCENVVKQINDNYILGFHSFNIIGSYGTGKSSFLWALEKQIKKEKKYFRNIIKGLENGKIYNFLKIVGNYESLSNSFSSLLAGEGDENCIIDHLEKYYSKCRHKDEGLIIFIDEFGKFLEYAVKNNPEKELYIIQQIAEFANDQNKNVLLVTSLHQNFEAYIGPLRKSQRNEWEKIKGRFKEIPFNEPVEQLLHIAATYLKLKNVVIQEQHHSEIIKTIKDSKVFPLKNYLINDLAKDLYPLDILTAAILTLSLQRYGQNERSLFTFLKSKDDKGINNYDISTNPYYNLDCLYDYLIQNFYSYLYTKFNPDYLNWTAIRNSLERAEPFFGENFNFVRKIIKSIGLINMFSSKSASITANFLEKYARICLGIPNSKKIMEVLEKKKIIRFQKYNHSFVLFEGTDLDIDRELIKASEIVELPIDITPKLKEYFSFPYIMAKSVYFKIGTPRFFEFYLSHTPIDNRLLNEVDGTINLIFNENEKLNSIIDISKRNNEAIIYGFHNNTDEIRILLLEIEKIKYILNIYPDDKVAQRELNELLDHQKNQLNHKILNGLFKNEYIWILAGSTITIYNQREFNKRLSSICEKVYHSTPIFKNELINRHKLSSSISLAKKNFFKHLIEYWGEKDLGFPVDKYPPEKTIYLSLLKFTGIHIGSEFSMIFSKPSATSFIPLWNACEKFLESTKNNKKSINELINILIKKPFKLKPGLLEFWIPSYLFIKKEDYSLFYDGKYIPELNVELFLLLLKRPDKFTIKAFNIDGIKIDLFNRYRLIIDKYSKNKISKSTFLETIKPFLLFYNSLPEFTKTTQKLSKPALTIRDAIAKSIDPEKLFFEDFPKALNFSLKMLSESDEILEEFIIKLQKGIKEIRNCFTNVIDRFEKFLLMEFGIKNHSFEVYKNEIQDKYKSIKKHYLLTYQKSFYAALYSEIDDKIIWYKSIIHSLIGNPAEKMNDNDELLIYDKLKSMIYQLDNLNEFKELNINMEEEELIKLEIISSSDGIQKNIIRLPKKKFNKSVKIVNSIKSNLTEDKKMNIWILLNLLKSELKDE